MLKTSRRSVRCLDPITRCCWRTPQRYCQVLRCMSRRSNFFRKGGDTDCGLRPVHRLTAVCRHLAEPGTARFRFRPDPWGRTMSDCHLVVWRRSRAQQCGSRDATNPAPPRTRAPRAGHRHDRCLPRRRARSQRQGIRPSGGRLARDVGRRRDRGGPRVAKRAGRRVLRSHAQFHPAVQDPRLDRRRRVSRGACDRNQLVSIASRKDEAKRAFSDCPRA